MVKCPALITISSQVYWYNNNKQQQQQQTTTTTKTFVNVSGVFSIAANWGHTKKEIMNVKMNKYILKG